MGCQRRGDRRGRPASESRTCADEGLSWRCLMALTETSLRQGADIPSVVALTAPLPVETRPSYDASPEAYRRLRHAVIEAGLLDRRYGYYLWRTLLSFGFVAAAVALAFVVPAGIGWSVLVVFA